MFEGKYFLNRFTLVTINVVRDVVAVELRRPSLAVIYSAQIFIIFGEKFFLADVCLQNEIKEEENVNEMTLCGSMSRKKLKNSRFEKLQKNF